MSPNTHLHGLEYAWVVHGHVSLSCVQAGLHLDQPVRHPLHDALVLIAAGSIHKGCLIGGSKPLGRWICLGEERCPSNLLSKADAQHAQEVLQGKEMWQNMSCII